MKYESFFFKFQGFIPECNVKSFVDSVAERIYFGAPSDSAMNFVIEKGQNVIRASCKIASQSGTFVAEAISDCPIKAVQKIEKKIKNQIDVWKKNRFKRTE